MSERAQQPHQSWERPCEHFTWDNRPGGREDPFVRCNESIFMLIIKQKRGNAAFPHLTMCCQLRSRTPALK